MGIDMGQLELLLEREQFTKKIYAQLNNFTNIRATLKTIMHNLYEYTHIQAIGIRLERDGDYPYYLYEGFPESFILHENSLCAKDNDGVRIMDLCTRSFVLECMCGNIIRKRTDASLPFFTKGGSFWSNHTTELLASTTDEDRQTRTRNYCNGCGYESVALIPIKYQDRNIGLIQLNDKRIGRFNLDLIEFVENIGQHIGLAVQNALMYSELEETRNKLVYDIEYVYKRLFDNMWEGFSYCKMIYDERMEPVDFIFIHVNNSFEKLTGWKGIKNKRISEIISNIVEKAPDLFKIYGRVATSGQAEQFETYFAPLKKWYKISAYCPEKGYFVSVFDDISKQKANEEKLENLVKQRTEEYNRARISAERANQAKSMFLMNMSHELRTPLNAIMGFAEVLKEEMAGPINEEQKNILENQLKSSEHLGSLISDLLDLTKIESGKLNLDLKSYYIRDVISSAVKIIQENARSRHISIDITAPEEKIVLNIDKRRILQVLLNLLSNALKYTNAQGEIGGRNKDFG